MCWFIANADLSEVIAFVSAPVQRNVVQITPLRAPRMVQPMVTMGPGVVNVLYGVVLYREVRGRRNFALLGAAFVVYLVACVCIVLSSK